MSTQNLYAARITRVPFVLFCYLDAKFQLQNDKFPTTDLRIKKVSIKVNRHKQKKPFVVLHNSNFQQKSPITTVSDSQVTSRLFP